jgi:glycolate oxidase
VGRISRNYIVQDGVIPRSEIARVLREIERLAAQAGLRVANVFHAGDGNLHPNILFDLRDHAILHQVESAGEEMLRAVVEFGGALSGEHGIGLEKNAFMPWVFSADDLYAMHQVKDALDPDGIMNPGKVFPDPDRKAPRLAGRTGLAIEAKWW